MASCSLFRLGSPPSPATPGHSLFPGVPSNFHSAWKAPHWNVLLILGAGLRATCKLRPLPPAQGIRLSPEPGLTGQTLLLQKSKRIPFCSYHIPSENGKIIRKLVSPGRAVVYTPVFGIQCNDSLTLSTATGNSFSPLKEKKDLVIFLQGASPPSSSNMTRGFHYTFLPLVFLF